MRRFPAHLLFFSVFLAACTESDPDVIPHLDRYDIRYMLYPAEFIMPDGKQHLVTLQFNDRGMPVRRTGDLVAAPYITGYHLQFTDQIFDTVVYHAEDRVTISKMLEVPDVYIPPDEKEIFLDRGRISRIIHTRGEGGGATIDTTDFYYDGAGLLLRTTGKLYRQSGGSYWLRSTTTRVYSFTDKNLRKIEEEEVRPSGSTTTTLELFDDYDNAPNPTRGLIFFDELFYRSLSTNNFRKYSLEQRNGAGEVIGRLDLSWTFAYDEKGMPVYH